MQAESLDLIKDRDLLARVAQYNPHLAGTVLKLCNDLVDGKELGELPPALLLREVGEYVQAIGRLVYALGVTTDLDLDLTEQSERG